VQRHIGALPFGPRTIVAFQQPLRSFPPLRSRRTAEKRAAGQGCFVRSKKQILVSRVPLTASDRTGFKADERRRSARWRSGDSRVIGEIITAPMKTPLARGVYVFREAVSAHRPVFQSRRLPGSPLSPAAARHAWRVEKTIGPSLLSESWNRRPSGAKFRRNCGARRPTVQGLGRASRRCAKSPPSQQGSHLKSCIRRRRRFFSRSNRRRKCEEREARAGVSLFMGLWSRVCDRYVRALGAHSHQRGACRCYEHAAATAFVASVASHIRQDALGAGPPQGLGRAPTVQASVGPCAAFNTCS